MLKAPRMSYAKLMQWVSTVSGRGVSAEYNHVNDHWGFKWFYSLETCLNNYSFQLQAFRNGWGPALGKYPVKFKLDNGSIRFGFLTERVITFSQFCRDNEIPYEYAYIDGNPDYMRYCGFSFAKKCRKIGWQICDEHGGNLGFSMVDNRPLWIDFGFFKRTTERAKSTHINIIKRYEKRIKDYCSPPTKKAVASGLRSHAQA